MKTNIKKNLNNLHLSDIYSLMLFICYKIQDIPDYAILSELCYLLDGANLTRLLTYFAGKTVTLEINPCNYNKTFYKGCVISVTDADGVKTVNALNFKNK